MWNKLGLSNIVQTRQNVYVRIDVRWIKINMNIKTSKMYHCNRHCIINVQKCTPTKSHSKYFVQITHKTCNPPPPVHKKSFQTSYRRKQLRAFHRISSQHSYMQKKSFSSLGALKKKLEKNRHIHRAFKCARNQQSSPCRSVTTCSCLLASFFAVFNTTKTML